MTSTEMTPGTEISVDDLDALRRAGAAVTVLDVREPEEIAICAFEESLNIPMGELAGNLASLPRQGVLVVVCHVGMRSQMAADWLRRNDFANAVSLTGGIDAWASRIDGAMPRY